jgi:hypothetical protein
MEINLTEKVGSILDDRLKIIKIVNRSINQRLS